MREIEFRGKIIDNSKWVYGDLIENIDCCKIREKEKVIKQIAKSYVVDEETLGQYTGLKDKNGTKIFDGDIVIWENIDDFDKTHKSSAFEITFDNKYFYSYVASRDFGKGCVLQFNFNDIRNKNIEVIGNIYDNPELLEV